MKTILSEYVEREYVFVNEFIPILFRVYCTYLKVELNLKINQLSISLSEKYNKF